MERLRACPARPPTRSATRPPTRARPSIRPSVGPQPLAGVRARAAEEFDRAEARFREALGYAPAFFEALAALAQLEFERAKLAAGLAVKPVR